MLLIVAMPPHLDPHRELRRILNKASKADRDAELRIERLWQAISKATFARDIYPLEQLFSVLNLLDQAGCPTPGLKATDLRKALDKVEATK